MPMDFIESGRVNLKEGNVLFPLDDRFKESEPHPARSHIIQAYRSAGRSRTCHVEGPAHRQTWWRVLNLDPAARSCNTSSLSLLSDLGQWLIGVKYMSFIFFLLGFLR